MKASLAVVAMVAAAALSVAQAVPEGAEGQHLRRQLDEQPEAWADAPREEAGQGEQEYYRGFGGGYRGYGYRGYGGGYPGYGYRGYGGGYRYGGYPGYRKWGPGYGNW